MTARTPLETLTLARDYLDSLLADSTPGPWDISQSGRWVTGDNDISAVPHFPDAALIVALHATAPAIRELLGQDIGLIERFGLVGTGLNTGSLAEAILSSSHAAQWITKRESDLVDEIEGEQWARDHMYDNPEEATQ